ncbi:MAG: prenyltransferase/squalene oxidase repeat-containing protein, partial [Planctomycetota bacterium]
MKVNPSKLPPDQDDFVFFKKVVSKSSPVFIAILIVLGLGAVLSRLVFSNLRKPVSVDAFVSIKGAMESGDEAKGPDEDEGAKGEEEPQKPEAPKKAEPAEESPLEPARWLEQVPSRAPLGPIPTAPSKPEAGGAKAMKPAVVAGSGGKGDKGAGRGTGSPWGSRKGTGRGEGTRRFGGNQASESAVENGLNWLRRHQSESGVWRADGFGSLCKSSEGCEGEALEGVGYDAGVTALSTMAFLGAGYTHREGRFKNTVTKALRYLILIQKPDGRFGSEPMYTQALAVIALAEALGMTSDMELRAPLRKGTAFLVSAQQAQGGWTYGPSPRKERNDTSITAFAIMALKSARATGVEVPEG